MDQFTLNLDQFTNYGTRNKKNTDILDFDDVNNTPFVSKRYRKTETKEEREITSWIDTIGRRAMISIFKT